MTGHTPALRPLRLLCIGNEGVADRGGQWWSYRCTGAFLAEMGGLAGETCWCAWSDISDDPLKQTCLRDIQGVRTLGLPAVQGPLLSKLLNGASALVMLAREVAYADFVYLYWPGRLSSIAARLCRIAGQPYGIYLRGEQVPSQRAFATAFAHARFVLTTGQALRAAARAYCPDVEDVTPMTALRPEHVVPPRLHRPPGPWRLLYVGRIEERKGVQDLLAAMSHLEQWGLPFILTMVGHCPDAPALMRDVPAPVARRVRLIGAVPEFDDLIPFYREADVFVLPSHDEGFPRVLYEAMAFGVLILTTFVGSIPGVMQDRENCLRVEVRNPGDIAQKLRLLFGSPELRSQIALSSHHSITKVMNTWKRSHARQVAEKLRGAVPGRC